MTLIQKLVVSTNITLANINLVVRISPSSFVVNGEKPEKFNGFNFKR
jgi:hypothetical protein